MKKESIAMNPVLSLVFFLAIAIPQIQAKGGPTIKGAVQVLKNLVPKMSGWRKEQLEEQIKTLEEGLKVKKGESSPRIVVANEVWKKRRRMAQTTPDDSRSKKFTKGWGKDQRIDVGLSYFQKWGEDVRGDCPNSTQEDVDALVLSLLATTLFHESIHVDQAGNPKDFKTRMCLDCQAYSSEYYLMLEITWSDPCLAKLWEKEVKGAFKAQQAYCKFCFF